MATLFVLDGWILTSHYFFHRRKERESKASEKKTSARNKRKATTAAKKTAKKAKDDDEDSDAALAKALSGKRESIRNRDATGKKNQKAKALAALREVSCCWIVVAAAFCCKPRSATKAH